MKDNLLMGERSGQGEITSRTGFKQTFGRSSVVAAKGGHEGRLGRPTEWDASGGDNSYSSYEIACARVEDPEKFSKLLDIYGDEQLVMENW